jgi:hypothetical protein
MVPRQGGGDVVAAYGLVLNAGHQRASGNQVVASTPVSGYGILANYTTDFCLDNTVGGFSANIGSACISSGNLTAP